MALNTHKTHKIAPHTKAIFALPIIDFTTKQREVFLFLLLNRIDASHEHREKRPRRGFFENLKTKVEMNPKRLDFSSTSQPKKKPPSTPEEIRNEAKPKRPRTAFLRFLSEMYPELKEKNPGMRQAELTKIASGMWNVLPSENQQPYRDAYRAENGGYLVEFAKWKEKYGKNTPTKEEIPDETKPPKRPRTAFLRFLSEVYLELKEKNPGTRQAELTKIASGMWNALPSENQQPYRDAYRTENEGYLVEFAKWKEKYGENTPTKEEILDETKPPKRPPTAFLRFLSGVYPELREKNPGTRQVELTKIASGMWNVLPSENQQPYRDAYRAENEGYLVEFAKWKEKYGKNTPIKEELPDETKPPKRPRTAFLRFLSEVYLELKEKNPGTRQVELTKIASGMWNALPSERQQPYRDAYRTENKGYLAEYAKWREETSTPTTEPPQHESGDDTKRPKPPQAAYFRFLEEVYATVRAQEPLASQKHALESIASLWKQMPDVQQEPYRESYRLERKQYEADLQKWKEKQRVLTTARPSNSTALVLSRQQRPKKPYDVFAKENRLRVKLTFPGMGYRQVDKQLHFEWQELPAEKRRSYARRSQGHTTPVTVTKMATMVDSDEEDEEEGVAITEE